MSKKGGSAPAPDPRLTEAQIRSMDQQNSMLQRIVAQGDEMLPLQKEQIQFGLDSAKTAYEQSQADRDWMLTRRNELAGLQDRQVQDAKDYNEGDRASQLVNQADADVNESFGLARDQAMRGLQRRGVNLSSGKALMMAQGTGNAQALARATAANKVREAARAEGFALNDRATNTLAGYPSMSMGATGAGAGFGSMGLGLANQGLGGMTSAYGQAAGIAGNIGQNATGMFNAQAQYKNGQDQIAGQSAGSTMGGLGSLVGAGAQLYKSGAFGAMLGMFSDPRLKENVVFVGRDPGTNLALYEFNYKADPSTRYRGVMADDVQRNYPQAVTRSPEGYLAVNYDLLGVPFTKV